MTELETCKEMILKKGHCEAEFCDDCFGEIYGNCVFQKYLKCGNNWHKKRVLVSIELLKTKYGIEYVGGEFKEIKKELTDIEKLEYLIKEGGSCHAEKLWQCEYCPVNELYTGFGGDGCRSDTASPLAQQKLSELKGEKKPKFEIGQKVRCTEHNVEFVIHHDQKIEGEYHYYNSEQGHRVCHKILHNGRNFGVPESQVELVEEEPDYKKPDMSDGLTRVILESKESEKLYICENADECKDHVIDHCIPHAHRDTCSNLCANFNKSSKCIPVSEYERRKEYTEVKVEFPDVRFEIGGFIDCESEEVGLDFMGFTKDGSRVFLESYEKPKKQNIFQKLFKRRKCMNDYIKEMFPKTKEACLVEDYLSEYFCTPLIPVMLKGKEAEVLELAKKLKEKAEKDEE